jgi:hypothetical protein
MEGGSVGVAGRMTSLPFLGLCSQVWSRKNECRRTSEKRGMGHHPGAGMWMRKELGTGRPLQEGALWGVGWEFPTPWWQQLGRRLGRQLLGILTVTSGNPAE